MSQSYKITQSRFFCTECGQEGLNIPRIKGQARESGHLKKLFCLHCNKEVNHAEIKEFGKYNIDDFKQEYELGRFVNGNRIAIKDLITCTCNNCQFNVNGKCWNSNWSNNCGHRVKEINKNE